MGTLLTLTEAAAATNRSRVTLRRYLDQGRLPNARRDEADPNRQWLIPATDLEAAGARLTEPVSDETALDGRSVQVRIAVAEALAEERLNALREITQLAVALHSQADAISRLLDCVVAPVKGA